MAWWRRSRLPRRPRTNPPAWTGPGRKLAEDEGTWSQIAAVLNDRAGAEGWTGRPGAAAAAAGGPGSGPPPPTARPAPPAPRPSRHWWRIPTLRRLALRSLPLSLLPAAIAALGAVIGGPAWTTYAALAAGDTAVSDGTVVRLDDDDGRPLPLLPHDTRVRFSADGDPAQAWVPATEKLRVGQVVTVHYAVDRPGRARLVGPVDGLTRNAFAGGLMTVLGGGVVGWRAYRLSRDLAALARARAGESRPWRYARFRDHAGVPGLMLFPRLDDPPPQVLLPLARLPADAPTLPVTGEAQVHGEVRDQGLIVPVIDGETCWPAGRAAVVPAAVVRDLVNGNPPPRVSRRRPAEG